MSSINEQVADFFDRQREQKVKEYRKLQSERVTRFQDWLASHWQIQSVRFASKAQKRLRCSDVVLRCRHSSKETVQSNRDELISDLAEFVNGIESSFTLSEEDIQMIGWYGGYPVFQFDCTAKARGNTYWLYPSGEWWRMRIEPGRGVDKLYTKRKLIKISALTEELL